MMTRIETTSVSQDKKLVFEIGESAFGNVAVTVIELPASLPLGDISDYRAPKSAVRHVQFSIDADTARSISFALGELAKIMGKRK